MSDFDLTVHNIDQKTKKLISLNEYKMHTLRVGPGETLHMFERDGKFYWQNNELVPDKENWIKNPMTGKAVLGRENAVKTETKTS